MASKAQRRRNKKITMPGGEQIDQKPSGRDRINVGQPKMAEDPRQSAFKTRLRIAGIPDTPEGRKRAVAPDFEIPPTHRVMCVKPQKEPTMKALILTAAFALAASTAMAETPNSTTMGWKAFAEASGCAFVKASDGTTTNLVLAADNTDPCPSTVRVAFFGTGSRLVDPDGIPANGDEFTVSDN